ncbi:MAG: Vms1/Ankzf1 family peptidyl-tRNA hydrolase, partial [Dehalococcoidia bacterium]
MSRARLERLLDELESGSTAGVTLYLTPGTLPSQVGPADPTTKPWLEELKELDIPVAASKTGAVLFWDDQGGFLILPPFPVGQDATLPGWITSALRTLLSQPYLLGVVLLRRGGYALGVFQGEHLVASKTGVRFVKGRHRAGGQSQRRFERTRERQLRELMDKACSMLQARFAAYEQRLDYVLLGGDRLTLQEFLKRCPY